MSKRTLLIISTLLTLALLIFFAYVALTAKIQLDANSDGSQSETSASKTDNPLAGLGIGIGLAIVMILGIICCIYFGFTLLLKLIAVKVERNGFTFFVMLFDIAAAAVLGCSLYPNLADISANLAEYLPSILCFGAAAAATVCDLLSFPAD